MSSQRACLAKTRSGAGMSVSARRSAGTFGPWFTKGLLAALAIVAGGAVSASAASDTDTDTAIWRAQHGLLLGPCTRR